MGDPGAGSGDPGGGSGGPGNGSGVVLEAVLVVLKKHTFFTGA